MNRIIVPGEDFCFIFKLKYLKQFLIRNLKKNIVFRNEIKNKNMMNWLNTIDDENFSTQANPR